MPGEGVESSDPVASVPEGVLISGGREREHPRRKGAGGTDAERARKGAGRPGPRTSRCALLPSRAWAGASREPGPLLRGLATCSPAGTARYTSSSCSASRGLSRRAGPSAAARSLPAHGPARRPPAAVPPGPGAARSAPAAAHRVLAPPVTTPPQGPSALVLEPPRRCASVADWTATPARPQGQKRER